MLQRTILSAEELGLKDDQLAALLEVRRMLAAGEVQLARASETDSDYIYFPPYRGATKAFHMSTFSDPLVEKAGDKVRCGTVHCIGGWIDHLTKTSDCIWLKPRENPALWDLFYPPQFTRIRTPADAVVAIDNFLATGRASWERI